MDDEKLKHEGLHTAYLGAHLKATYNYGLLRGYQRAYLG
jgi:hypothetical protein